MSTTTPAAAVPLLPITSSAIACLGYCEDRRVLAVQLHNGHVWHYADISPELAAQCSGAPSIGGFWARNIKGKFPATKITGICDKCGAIGPMGDRCADCGCGMYRGEDRIHGENG